MLASRSDALDVSYRPGKNEKSKDCRLYVCGGLGTQALSGLSLGPLSAENRGFSYGNSHGKDGNSYGNSHGKRWNPMGIPMEKMETHGFGT